MADIKIITTEDGSHSLYHSELNETYHSFHGAIRESNHVFIQAGLNFLNKDDISVFEVGFGTGLNALLTAIWAERLNKTVVMHSIEAYPISDDIASALNYGDLVEHLSGPQWLQTMHEQPWGIDMILHDHFQLRKIHALFSEAVLDRLYDIIYYDAFAPSKQPDMWTQEIIEKAVNMLSPGGCFVTYCAQGQLKRTLKALQLEVETLPGPPGKKEMVRAVKRV